VVHAAAGGVGQLLVQMLVARGVRVVATVGTAAKAEIAAALGAAAVVRYDEIGPGDELAAALCAATVSGRAHVVFDGVGAATFDASLASLHPRGMLVLFGAASGAVPPVDPQRLNSGGSLYLTRPTLGHYVATTEELRARAADVLGGIAGGELRVAIGGRFALEEAAEAYRMLEGRRSVGKLLLVP
jgi:NADPH2:quinone reductase